MSNALSLLNQCDHYYVSPWEILSIRGTDAMDLLNRILTLDTKRLEISRGSWAFLLNHRGQVKQAMWLLKLSVDHFLAISETGVAELADAIDMFVFSEDVHFSHLHESVCIYTSGNIKNPHQSENRWFSIPIRLFNHQEDHPSQESLLIGPHSELTELKLSSLSESEFTKHRITTKGALPSREYRSGTPLDVSLVGISEGKGCYPGQEAIERTIALSRPAQVTLGALISFESVSELDELLSRSDHNHEESPPLALFEQNDEEKRGREIGLLTSLMSPLSLDDETAPSLIAIIKLKNRVAQFEDRLSCYLDLKGSDPGAQIKISISKR